MHTETPWRLYTGLSTPIAVTDGEWRVVFLNGAAQALYGVQAPEVLGRVAWAALRLTPPPGDTSSDWVREVVVPSLSSDAIVPCRVAGQPAELVAIPLIHDERPHVVLAVTRRGLVSAPEPEMPDWALRDPLTGVHNRHHWRREFERWNAESGAVIFLDLDGLKEINDFGGHDAGDRALAMVGRAVLGESPSGALMVRHGGDEFVVVVGQAEAARAGPVAEAIVAKAEGFAREASAQLPLHLSYGVARYQPGGLARAVREADESLYERKGVLLRGAHAGRIILTREGRTRVQRPGEERAEPAPFARGFGTEFDAYFRAAYARATDQAREFVEFAAPVAGEAVVEVGAGSGRITFDGGLAERIGPSGQLLVTDPSAAQLSTARRRAAQLGFEWVRFMEAPVEALPIVSGTVDLVLGSTFMHFVDPAPAFQSMARAVRPGGRVVFDATVEIDYHSGWQWALEPVFAEMRANGRSLLDVFPRQEDIEAMLAAAGLKVERITAAVLEQVAPPTAEIAAGAAQQLRLARLMLRGAPGIPEERLRTLEGLVADRVRERFGAPELDWATGGNTIKVAARRPEG